MASAVMRLLRHLVRLARLRLTLTNQNTMKKQYEQLHRKHNVNHITFSIDDSTGNTTFLLNEDTRAFVDSTSVIKRASHVEPVNLFIRIVFYTIRFLFGEYGRAGDFTRQWPCRWRVNFSPVDGPL